MSIGRRREKDLLKLDTKYGVGCSASSSCSIQRFATDLTPSCARNRTTRSSGETSSTLLFCNLDDTSTRSPPVPPRSMKYRSRLPVLPGSDPKAIRAPSGHQRGPSALPLVVRRDITCRSTSRRQMSCLSFSGSVRTSATDRPAFVFEERPARRIEHRGGGGNLDRDDPIETTVKRLHLSAAADAEQRRDLVRSEPLTRVQSHRWVSVDPLPVTIRIVRSKEPMRMRSPSSSNVTPAIG